MTSPTTLDELHRHLAQFSGTECYHRTHPGLLATDGAKYLADAAAAYWLLDIVWSVLPKLDDECGVLELSLEHGPHDLFAHGHRFKESHDPQRL